MEDEIIEEVLELQNEETKKLAEQNISLAYEFAETLNLEVIKHQLNTIEGILLNQGIFLQDWLDL